MAQSYEPYRERTATASVDVGRVQPGWTVYDALDRPIGNVTELEGGELRVDGRPEGIGFYNVPADTIRAVEEGKVYLTIDVDRWRGGPDGLTAGRESGGGMDAEAAFEDTAPIDRTFKDTARPAERETMVVSPSRQREEIHGSSYTASGTPVGLGSNTPVGDEPNSFRDWESDVEPSPWSRLGLAAGPIAIGAASAGAYLWWRNRQARRSRLARLTRGLAAAGGSMAPVLDAARERRSAWWLASLAVLPLAYYLRSGDRERLNELVPDVAPSTAWRDRLPAVPVAMPEAVESPPLWTAAIPVALAGLAAAWLAARKRGSATSTRGTRRLHEIMTRNVEVVRPDSTIFEAATTMRRLGVGFLPVCDGRRLQGTLTDRDIVVRTVSDSRDPQVATVRDAMSPEVVYAFEDDTVERAAALMRQHQIRRLPIVDRNKSLVGVVSLGDVAVDSGSDELSGATLERISEPARPRR